MANLNSVTTNYFPVSSETYTNNINVTIGAGATTVPVNSASAYTDGDVVVLTVDPGTASQATFTGVKASSPDRFINCFWTEGNTGVGHSNGAVITDYDSATHYNIVSKGVRQFANQDGSLKTTAVQSALNLGTASLNGWNPLGYAPASVTPLGNRSYSMVFNGVDLTSVISPGMRLRTTRTVAAPTQCTNLNGTNQYWSKTTPAGLGSISTGLTAGAWLKLTSYPATGQAAIIDNANTADNSGFNLTINTSGQLRGYYGNGAAFTDWVAYQSIPLNKWVHVAWSVTSISGKTGAIYIDGVAVPTSNTTATATSIGTTTQPLTVGAFGASLANSYFPGKLAQVFLFSAGLAQATIQNYMNQGLAGNEPNCISAYAFNGNANDLNTTNANNLTANSGVLATTADSPFGGQAGGTISSTLDYAIPQSVTLSGGNTTVIAQVPEGCTIPTNGVSAVVYSANKAPYGFRPDELNLLGYVEVRADQGGIGAADLNGLSLTINAPTSMKIRITAQVTGTNNTANNFMELTLLEGSTTLAKCDGAVAMANGKVGLFLTYDIAATAGTHTYKLNLAGFGGVSTLSGSISPCYLKIENISAYL